MNSTFIGTGVPGKKPLVILTGPTAVGKTELSLKLAKITGGSIVSADSMQVYRGMDIGSAKIKTSEMEDVPHYLIDILDPKEDFNVFSFREKAMEAIEEIYSKGRLPILAGGTGFYIQAVIKDIQFSETGNIPSLRGTYEEIVRTKGPEALHAMLREADPVSADAIHPNNVKRVIRALEYFAETGHPISGHNEEQKNNESPFDYCYFVLTRPREQLYGRIDKRVDEMLAAGLEKEVRGLISRGLTESNISMKGIGYSQFFPYFRGEITYEELAAKIKQDTRHFAKRQLTWFKREKNVIWFDKDELSDEEILSRMTDIIENKFRREPVS